ncbi:DUF58 domain-containing protein [Ruminiclostridium papyrosolvens]|uniref:DUF58 domain-containing protein n=1 Tax=Ruminiclostridium papyrosolvens C7 TaxID=1330534 RepID=U4R1F3_9FIRM|nr:DUF58 domain-containing protein [Ruminiclostridium papyrosolvens]EPR11868.1 hypothetical protein L323_10820 [Ruminiclostridium papyrosolvens C7]
MLFLQIALALPLLILIETILFKRFLLKGVVYRRTISETSVFEGDKISMIEDIENNSFLPIAWMKAESRISPNLEFNAIKNMQVSQGGYHRSVFSIMPFYRLKRTHTVTCLKRGEYNVGNVTLTAGDILGFVTKILSYDNEVRLLVYPSPLSENRMVDCYRSLQGDAVVRRFINPDPFLVAGVREYQAGDPVSSINWKSTARTNSLQVYKYDYSADTKLLILFNIDSSSSQDNYPNEKECEKIELGIHFCASIVDKTIKQGISTGFCCNGHFRDQKEIVNIPSRCSKIQLFTIFEAMAKLQLHRVVSFYTMIKNIKNSIPKDTDILIVSLYNDEKIQEQVHELKRSGHDVETWIITESEVE